MIKSNTINLREIVFSYLIGDDMALYLLNFLESYNELILFGGAVRDYIVYNCFEPRDIDIVLVGPSECLPKLEQSTYFRGSIHKNNFDGYKVLCKNSVFDIWNISDTWAFKENLVEQSIENLLNTVFLNIDAYAYNLTKQSFKSLNIYYF